MSEVVELAIEVDMVVEAAVRLSVMAEGADEVSCAGSGFIGGVSDGGSVSGAGGGGLGALSGVVVVGAGSICWRMRSGTVAGVTLSMNVKAGRRRTVVGAEAGG